MDAITAAIFLTCCAVLLTACALRSDLLFKFLGRTGRFARRIVRTMIGRRAIYCCELLVDCFELCIRVYNDVRKKTKKDPSIREVRIYYETYFTYNIAVPEGVPPDLDVNSDIKELPQTWKIDGYNGH